VRVESGDHWAELSEEPFTWGARNRLRDAADGPFFASFAVALVAERTTAWSEPGDPTKPEAWDSVDDKFGDADLQAALQLWKDAPDPNAASGDDKSSPSPPDSESATPTPS
jgi:hypothetical protein